MCRLPADYPIHPPDPYPDLSLPPRDGLRVLAAGGIRITAALRRSA